jgi:hypothetical protein
MKLLILALRRSGSTIFWSTFRQDRRLVCYDEPFNRRLMELPRAHEKGTIDEYVRLLQVDPRGFWERYTPVDRVDEVRAGLSDRQAGYLRYLADSHDRVVMDLTRCHFKVEALRQVVPEAFVLHLHRAPAAFATSHLRPWLAQAERRWLRIGSPREAFWGHEPRCNGWGLEEVMGTGPTSLFGIRLQERGYDPARVQAAPATARLLAFWQLHHDVVEEAGRRHFGERFLSLRFEDFCRDPASTVAGVCGWMGAEMPALDFGAVHPPAGAFLEGAPGWTEAARAVGVPADPEHLFRLGARADARRAIG